VITFLTIRLERKDVRCPNKRTQSTDIMGFPPLIFLAASGTFYAAAQGEGILAKSVSKALLL
jgi:hypothetical protein